jgi:hypothetical protein
MPPKTCRVLYNNETGVAKAFIPRFSPVRSEESNVWLFEVYDAAVAKWEKSEAFQKKKKADQWLAERRYKVIALWCICLSNAMVILVFS